MLKTREIIIYIVAGILLIITWNIAANFYVERFHEDVQEKPKRYCYDAFVGVINPVMIITDLEYKEELVSYYDKLANGDETPVFNFPLKSIMFTKQVFVIEEGPEVAKIIYYHTDDRYGNYLEGYVDKRTVHKEPPADSLLKAKEDLNYEMENVYKLDSINRKF